MDDHRSPDRLSASDSLLWRIESDPVLRSPVLVVGLLDRSPTPEGLEAMVDRAATIMPQLARRLEVPPLGLGRPRWRSAREPSLAAHVRRVRAPGGDVEAVLAVAEPDATAAFDPARPLWTLTVVDGLDGGRAAVVLRFHHALTDGVGGVGIADALFDRSRRPARRGVLAPGPAAQGAPASRPGLPTALVAGARWVAAALGRPTRAASGAVRLARSAGRMLAPAPAAGSPVLAGRSLDRWLAVADRPLDAFRRAAAPSGGTVNDVLLGAVAGAAGAYHRAQGSPVATVRVTMPISVRRPGDPAGGNRFVPARFVLPVDDPDPAARVRIARALARSSRDEPALGVSGLVAAGLDLLPPPLAARLFAGMLRSTDVNVVDVPGLDRRAFLAGARIDRLWAFAPPAGAALSVTLVSHDGRACIAVACDRLAVADPELFQNCLAAALDETLALGGAPGRRTDRRPA